MNIVNPCHPGFGASAKAAPKSAQVLPDSLLQKSDAKFVGKDLVWFESLILVSTP